MGQLDHNKIIMRVIATSKSSKVSRVLLHFQPPISLHVVNSQTRALLAYRGPLC
jgi:hypothetical protein